MKLPDAEELLASLANQIRPLIRPNTAIVGIYSGGAWLAERLLPLLRANLEYGVLDISFYRDDYNQRGLHSQTKPSQISFEVEGKHIILIDDVFYTGRTIRAAMNELFDYGRPASISLAVLINRGGRELPIAPQVVAADIPLEESKIIQLRREENGRFYLTLEENA